MVRSSVYPDNKDAATLIWRGGKRHVRVRDKSPVGDARQRGDFLRYPGFHITL